MCSQPRRAARSGLGLPEELAAARVTTSPRRVRRAKPSAYYYFSGGGARAARRRARLRLPRAILRGGGARAPEAAGKNARFHCFPNFSRHAARLLLPALLKNPSVCAQAAPARVRARIKKKRGESGRLSQLHAAAARHSASVAIAAAAPPSARSAPPLAANAPLAAVLAMSAGGGEEAEASVATAVASGVS